MIPTKITNRSFPIYNTLKIPNIPNWIPIQIPDSN